MDHVVLVLFENRSFDNLLGHLYGPEDGRVFEGVIGKGLSNPIPEWAEHGAKRKTVPYKAGTDMDAPSPDSGEEVSAPWNAPEPGAVQIIDSEVPDPGRGKFPWYVMPQGPPLASDFPKHLLTNCCRASHLSPERSKRCTIADIHTET
jgi:hypothetical protein